MTLSAREAVEHYGFEGAVRYFVWLSEEYPLHAWPWQGLADLALMQGDERLASLLSQRAQFLGNGMAVPADVSPAPPPESPPSQAADGVTASCFSGFQAARPHEHASHYRSEPVVVDTNQFRHYTVTIKDVGVAVFWIGLTLWVIILLSCSRSTPVSSSPTPTGVQEAPVPRLDSKQDGPAAMPNPGKWFDPPGVSIAVLRGWIYLSSFRQLDDRYSLLLKSETTPGVEILVEVSKKPEARTPKDIAASFDHNFRLAYKDKYRLIATHEAPYGSRNARAWTFSQLSKGAWLYKQDVLFKLSDDRLVAVLLSGPEESAQECKSDFIDLVADIGEDPGEATK